MPLSFRTSTPVIQSMCCAAGGTTSRSRTSFLCPLKSATTLSISLQICTIHICCISISTSRTQSLFPIFRRLKPTQDLYHPNWDDQIIAVEGAEFVGHAEDGAGAELERGFVDHLEDAGQAFVRRGGLFDLQRAEFSVALEDDVDLFGVAVAVEVEIRLQARILIALHNLRNSVVFQQRAAHGAALGHLRGGPAREITDKAGIIEVHLRRLDRAFQDVVGVGVQQKNDPQHFENIDPRLGGLDVDIGVLRQSVVIEKLGAAGGDGGDEAIELQRVHAAGELAHVPLHIGGEIGRIEDVPIRRCAADEPRHGAAPEALEELRRGDRGNLIPLGQKPLHIRGKRHARRAEDLPLRHRRHMQQRHAASQRFLHAAHEAEDLRTGHPEIAGIVMLVDVDLDIDEELRRVLDLVDQHRRSVKLQEQRRIVLRHVPLGEIVQRHVAAADILLLRQFPQHGRLTRLPGTGQQDRRVRAAQLQNAVFHMSADVFHKAPPEIA